MFQAEAKLYFIERYCNPGEGWLVHVDIDASEEGRTGGSRKSEASRKRCRLMKQKAAMVRKKLVRMGVHTGFSRKEWAIENCLPLVTGDRDIIAFHRRKKVCKIVEVEGDSVGQPETKLYKAIGQIIMAVSQPDLHDWKSTFVIAISGEGMTRHLRNATALDKLGIHAYALARRKKDDVQILPIKSVTKPRRSSRLA